MADFFKSGQISVRVQLMDPDFEGPLPSIPVEGTLTIDEITGVVHIVIDSGTLDIASIPNLTIVAMPNLNIATFPNINIASLPSITIADIVNLNVDSLPALTGTLAISSIGGTLTITGSITINDTTAIDTTVTMNQVNVAASSVTIIAANANRKWFSIRNQHLSGDVYFYFGSTATLTNGTLLLNGESFSMGRGGEDGKYVYKGIITAISANATNKPISFMEGT